MFSWNTGRRCGGCASKIDPKKIEYLRIARSEENLGENAFRQVGENIRAVRTDFQLIEEWKSIRLAA